MYDAYMHHICPRDGKPLHHWAVSDARLRADAKINPCAATEQLNMC
jgi:hypothetical protein